MFCPQLLRCAKVGESKMDHLLVGKQEHVGKRCWNSRKPVWNCSRGPDSLRGSTPNGKLKL